MVEVHIPVYPHMHEYLGKSILNNSIQYFKSGPFIYSFKWAVFEKGAILLGAVLEVGLVDLLPLSRRLTLFSLFPTMFYQFRDILQGPKNPLVRSSLLGKTWSGQVNYSSLSNCRTSAKWQEDE